ncbi:MAG: bifunctional proline dehydrogenase/L-glutamate gamma-semialdehyde dehydrogenase [Mobiluncus sp.]|uniref:bifunctional proline dehydrogenase/L-glutamate gamma-semialdehyde dehydrogenase n=1 Tax=Mobiluncus sp. TaxID=47293 RepID=UPI002586ABA1|nr:bifunctional proline dehydrogenase/L-glutamate gamma-semialdehyde dehydrogenase [Mobiluncus sp.]MCI6584397.1 bifunctional proline dehydrogenase/L-glutamate gamma-semialdehyde dehydrogenase [Mobiluncus sp.]
MNTLNEQELAELREVGELAIERAKKWVEESKKYPIDYASKLLSKTLKDPKGLDFTVAFVDEVVRPEDKKIAGKNLAALVKSIPPKFLPTYLKLPAIYGGAMGAGLPEVAVPAARRVFRELVGDLAIDVTDKSLGTAIGKLRADGSRLNMNLLGEAVLGQKEAKRRLNDVVDLLQRDDVDYVSIKVSAVTGPHIPWDYKNMVELAVENLLPLYREANRFSPKKFINLDMEEYHDLHMTIDVFKRLLEHEDLQGLEAGIVLQAYLPDSLDAMVDLQEWAAKRVEKGGAPIKVRVVKGANLSMEHVDAQMHGWPMTTQPDKAHTDANYIRILNYALTAEHAKNIRIGVAGMNVFTAGFAYELANKRGVFETKGCEFEMLTGMNSSMARAVAEDTGPLLYYVPVVHPEEFDVAISYLVRRLEEIAAPENFMSAAFDLTTSEEMLNRELNRFQDAIDIANDIEFGPRRHQDRAQETAEEIESQQKNAAGEWEFKNVPDSDSSLPANVKWAEEIAAKMKDSKLGVETVNASKVSSEAELQEVLARAEEGGKKWAALGATERGEILHRAGVIMSQRRADLIEVMGSEAGKALDQGDVEVSEAVDYAHYYAESAKTMEKVAGAKFTPAQITVVTPPWNFPVAIPGGSTIAGLAAGSPVILKPATPARRCGALLAECLWEAGVPREVLQLVTLANHDLGKTLMTDPRVERVILTGSIETAQMFRSWRPDLGLLAETSGKNAIIVTPSADLDLAVKDVVSSAFGHAGQKCSAASLVILVGTVGVSKRFHHQLIDAVKSLHVGYPWDLGIQMGPVVEQPGEKLLRGLTQLEPDQTWAIKPRKLDDSGRLWSPGVRAGVEPGSEYHLVEYFGPILGVMRCDTLEEAVEIQNQVEYGLTGGIHSLNPREIQYWLDHVEVGNAYINRGITGAIVRRQPFGGWKRSVVGAGSKAGGPNYLYALGEWSPDDAGLSKISGSASGSLAREILDLGEELGADEKLAKSLASDEFVYNNEINTLRDPSQVGVERNIFRCLPVPVVLRVGPEAQPWEVARVLHAGLLVGSQITLSCATALPSGLASFAAKHGVSVMEQDETAWLDWAKLWAKGEAGYDGRIRIIGETKEKVAAAIEGNVDVAIWDHPVTYAGNVEMIPFFHEQAVALTNHRFGDPTPITEGILEDRVVDY